MLALQLDPEQKYPSYPVYWLSQTEAKELVADLQRAINEAADHQMQFPLSIMSPSTLTTIFVRPK